VHHHPARADEVAAGASDGEVVDGRDRVAGADLGDGRGAGDAVRGCRANRVAFGEVPGGDPAAVNGLERLESRRLVHPRVTRDAEVLLGYAIPISAVSCRWSSTQVLPSNTRR
jgi:hypothetical protein